MASLAANRTAFEESREARRRLKDDFERVNETQKKALAEKEAAEERERNAGDELDQHRDAHLSTEKVGAAAARILARNHGQRYFSWEYKNGTFSYFEHPVNLEREKTYEGKWVIQTEEPHLSPVEAVQMKKVNNMIMDKLGTEDQVADVPSVVRYACTDGVFDGPYRAELMHVGTDTTKALGNEWCVARIATCKNVFDATVKGRR